MEILKKIPWLPILIILSMAFTVASIAYQYSYRYEYCIAYLTLALLTQSFVSLSFAIKLFKLK